ncbi:MAG: PIG-L family deacetylase [Candidatus Woesearchaeota archaeon]|nr:MAG: PIG-L family deacetylase [Candidatus Woesearchaeota archaeon]
MNTPSADNRLLLVPSKILTVFAHADDEVIGCGGTLKANFNRGGTNLVLCLTGGDNITRAKELADATSMLGADYNIKSFAEGALGTTHGEVTDIVVQTIREFRPEYIITHRPEDDYHQDHQDTGHLVLHAAKKAQAGTQGHFANGVLLTETHSMHPDFHVAVDISNEYETVLAALQAHASQHAKGSGYYSDLIKAKTALRGLQAGCERAEAFQFRPIGITGAFHRRNYGRK